MVSKEPKIESQKRDKQNRINAKRCDAYPPLGTFFSMYVQSNLNCLIQPAECCQIRIGI